MAKKKSASVQRGQVKLREKKLKDGSSSLYLDINVGGKRQKEYLKLYQVVPTTPQEREQNRQALAAANAMRAKRELEIINGKFDITQPKQEGVRFLDYTTWTQPTTTRIAVLRRTATATTVRLATMAPAP